MDLSDGGEPMLCEENDVKIPDDAFDDLSVEQEEDDEVYPLQRSTFFPQEQEQAGAFEIPMMYFFTRCPCLNQPEQDISDVSGMLYVECEDIRYGPTTRVFIDQPDTAMLDASHHAGYKSHVSCYDCFMKSSDQRLCKYHIAEVYERQTRYVHGLPAIAFHYSNTVKRNNKRVVAFRNTLKLLQPPSSVPVEIGWTIASAVCLLRVMDTQGVVDGVDHRGYAENARKWTQATLTSNVLNQLPLSSSCRAFHSYVRETVLPLLAPDHPLTQALRTALLETPPPPGIYISTTPCPSTTAATPSTPATSIASALGRMDIQSPLPSSSSSSSSSFSVRKRCLGSGSSVDSLYEVPGAPVIMASPVPSKKPRKGRKPNPEKKKNKKKKQCVLLQDADLSRMTKDEQTQFLRPIRGCLRTLRKGTPKIHQAKTIALMHRVHEVNPGYVDSLKLEEDRINYRSFLLSHPN